MSLIRSDTTLHRLATHRGEPAVSSIYLDVDGANRPVASTYDQAFEQLADDLRRRAGTGTDPRLVRSVEGDIERMRTWLRQDIDRSVTRGLALFSCDEQDWFEAIRVPVAVRDEAAVGPAPHIRQLVALLDESEPFHVALVDHSRLRLFSVDRHDVDERPTFAAHQERAIDDTVELGSWQHHDEETARVHLRRAADVVDAAVRSEPIRRLVLGGPDEPLAEMEQHLHPTTRELVVGRVAVRVAASAEEITEAARAVAERAGRDREAGIVEEVRQRAAGKHGVAVGLEATLAALADRRVKTLLVRDDFVAPGAVCSACGHAGPNVDQCPVCGAANVELDDAVEWAIESAVAQDADVTFCRGTELDDLGSIAAIHRY